MYCDGSKCRPFRSRPQLPRRKRFQSQYYRNYTQRLYFQRNCRLNMQKSTMLIHIVGFGGDVTSLGVVSSAWLSKSRKSFQSFGRSAKRSVDVFSVFDCGRTLVEVEVEDCCEVSLLEGSVLLRFEWTPIMQGRVREADNSEATTWRAWELLRSLVAVRVGQCIHDFLFGIFCCGSGVESAVLVDFCEVAWHPVEVVEDCRSGNSHEGVNWREWIAREGYGFYVRGFLELFLLYELGLWWEVK